ncbi:hypothetical protein T11_7594 [Trichinella zimbabwensis]|uniref:Uncharacterized protein n=1 Tax=Trichinella zimbabwensis TaxID=268475 RepID=A0A0V1GUT5_9BILA|nr:hypothetical protein T11_7594 [Trichinella zimbabwensis]
MRKEPSVHHRLVLRVYFVEERLQCDKEYVLHPFSQRFHVVVMDIPGPLEEARNGNHRKEEEQQQQQS